MIDQEYVASITGWQQGMELSIEQQKNSVAFHEKEIELHTKHIAVLSETIIHDETRLAKAKAEFDKYLEDNKS